MLVLAVAQRARADGVLGVGEVHPGRALVRPTGGGEGDRHFEGREQLPPVATGPPDEMGHGVVVRLGRLGPETASRQQRERVDPERFEAKERRARQQRWVDLEERVLGRCADEHEETVLHARQERVLLGLVEPVDLVEEQDRAGASLPEPLARSLDDLAHVLHRGRHRRELLEGLRRAIGDQSRQRRLADAGRTPEDHRRQPVGVDEGPQRPTGGEQVLLADDLVEHPRSQPGGER